MCEADLQQGAVDVVLLGLGPGFWGEVLQQGVDGGGDVGHQHEGDQGAGRHLPGPVHGRAATPGDTRCEHEGTKTSVRPLGAQRYTKVTAQYVAGSLSHGSVCFFGTAVV